MLKAILTTFKVNHYIKNALVFIPLIFSLNFFNLKLFGNECIMFISFCLISSAVYILNDLVDIKGDKQHPIKCKRPIASGKISEKLAKILLIFLFVTGTFLASFLNFKCILIVVLYFVLNVFYSFKLKNIPLIDAACIALGFILRVVSGCAAISVIPSALIVLLTFFSSMFFTFSKRKLEIDLLNSTCRESIKQFNPRIADQFVLINAILSISFYITYVLDGTTVERVGSEYLYLTVIPFTLIVFRLLFLVNLQSVSDDPMHFIENDKTIKFLFVFYLLVFTCIAIK